MANEDHIFVKTHNGQPIVFLPIFQTNSGGRSHRKFWFLGFRGSTPEEFVEFLGANETLWGVRFRDVNVSLMADWELWAQQGWCTTKEVREKFLTTPVYHHCGTHPRDPIGIPHTFFGGRKSPPERLDEVNRLHL